MPTGTSPYLLPALPPVTGSWPSIQQTLLDMLFHMPLLAKFRLLFHTSSHTVSHGCSTV